MDNQGGALLSDPAGERRPIVREMRLTRTQMNVRNLNDPKSHGISTLYFFCDVLHPPFYPPFENPNFGDGENPVEISSINKIRVRAACRVAHTKAGLNLAIQ
jgi:hypothetical protein